MKTEKQLTAVEWLFIWCNSNPNPTDEEFVKAFNEAKEMEKEQIMDAFIFSKDPFGVSIGNSHTIKKAEQYYNETFKSE